MSIKLVARNVTLTIILSTYLTSTVANAQRDQQSGQRRGPPPEAIEACVDSAEGEACSFTGHRGDVTGSCIIAPRDQEEMVCAPEGGPPGDRDKR